MLFSKERLEDIGVFGVFVFFVILLMSPLLLVMIGTDSYVFPISGFAHWQTGPTGTREEIWFYTPGQDWSNGAIALVNSKYSPKDWTVTIGTLPREKQFARVFRIGMDLLRLGTKIVEASLTLNIIFPDNRKFPENTAWNPR